MSADADSRRAIRELVESWAVWRDAGEGERLRAVWHEGREVEELYARGAGWLRGGD